MGINLSDLVSGSRVELRSLKGRWIAIDAFNTIYQFLSSIRTPDGQPLKDSRGRPTSHLKGLLTRVANYLKEDVRLIFVFDGEPHQLKQSTLERRAERKMEAEVEWKEALERGDLETARVKAQQTSRITDEIVEDSKRLLELMGVPFVQAPQEGEAQAAYMAQKGEVFAAASQDYDSLLFGAPRLLRNLALSGKRKLPGRSIYVEVHPELILLEKVLKELEITREQLIDLAILVGTDFNPGVKGVGPKTALKLIKKYGSLENVISEMRYSLLEYEEVRKIFLRPPVTDNYHLILGRPDIEGIVEFLCDERDFQLQNIQKSLNDLKAAEDSRRQATLESWF
ncbi:MAG: flap endonuclease-1 [Thermoplasmata archaeon]|nr:MAG: flap endonuclease-1 [Thermoplasmata archaeon]RLF74227.1 MAG: flap endonuclease-1 [Thermoplasmata archaeon]RLF74680.1 MAG: flap endonuclease-1 [Thermoplasmata archaeon]HDD60195.1 flap endonuclease-1 [Euryarchaeota archaeon]